MSGGDIFNCGDLWGCCGLWWVEASVRLKVCGSQGGPPQRGIVCPVLVC